MLLCYNDRFLLKSEDMKGLMHLVLYYKCGHMQSCVGVVIMSSSIFKGRQLCGPPDICVIDKYYKFLVTLSCSSSLLVKHWRKHIHMPSHSLIHSKYQGTYGVWREWLFENIFHRKDINFLWNLPFVLMGPHRKVVLPSKLRCFILLMVFYFNDT